MAEQVFTIPDNWQTPQSPALTQVERTPDPRLIPPGIRDPRSRAVLGAFVFGAKAFDFRRLLARVSVEMTTEDLPLALYERQLNDYLGPDGLPESVVRALIDNAFFVKGLEGQDEGVKLALSLLGIRAEIQHWWQVEPALPHDTQTVSVFFENLVFADAELGDETYRKAAMQVVKATKRFSQETAYRFGVMAQVNHFMGVIGSHGARYVAALPTDDPAIYPSTIISTAVSLFGGRYQAALPAA